MKYEEFKYIYPPRPERVILPDMLSILEHKGWIAQIKKNGQYSIFAISPDKSIICMNRHNEVHRNWTIPAEISGGFNNLPDKWFYFCGEVLHNKTPHIKNTVYMFDILVHENEYLIGTTFKERHRLLHNLFQFKEYLPQYNKVNDSLWIANNYHIGFKVLFESLGNVEDEGLVLKDPESKLQFGDNSSWQAKCRKPTKNYSY